MPIFFKKCHFFAKSTTFFKTRLGCKIAVCLDNFFRKLPKKCQISEFVFLGQFKIPFSHIRDCIVLSSPMFFNDKKFLAKKRSDTKFFDFFIQKPRKWVHPKYLFETHFLALSIGKIKIFFLISINYLLQF